MTKRSFVRLPIPFEVDSREVNFPYGDTTEVELTWKTGPNDAGTYDALVRPETGKSKSTSVRVIEPATFDVRIDSTNSPVVEGEPLDVTATVTNTGGEAGTQDVVLNIDGSKTNSTAVSLKKGESQTVTLAWETAAGDAGDHEASVVSENDSAETVVTVVEPATFDVRIDSTNSPVVEGEPLDVTATITNTGGVPGNQTVELAVDGIVEDLTTVTLDKNESRTVTLTWRTGTGDRGHHTASVTSADDSDATGITVVEPAHFTVEIDTTNSSVVEGESLDVTATVTNTGGEAGTQDVVLNIDGSEEDSTAVTVDSGESRTVTLTWETAAGDAGDHEASVVSEDDSAETVVTVVKPAHFTVEIDSTNSPVVEGEPLDVTATVTNTGGEAGTQDVVLYIDGSEEDTVTTPLDPGGSRTVTLVWETGVGDAGEHTAEVASEDDSNTTGVTVVEPAHFTVEIDTTNSPVVEGEPLDVTATVTNTGGAPGTQDVVLSIDGERIDSTAVTVGSGESRTVTLTWETATGDAGDHEASVVSENDSAETVVTVVKPATFDVRIDSTNSPVVEGEPLEVTATVTNTGGAPGTQDVVLTIDGERIDSTTTSLAGGDSQVVSLTWNTSPGDAGEHTAEVASDSNSDVRGVSVVAAGTGDSGDSDPARDTTGDSDPARDTTFEVSIDDVRLPETAGESLQVDATIENTGSRRDTQVVRLTVNGEERDSQEVTLAAGESRLMVFTWPEPVDAAEYNLRLDSDDDFDESSLQLDGTDGDGVIGGVIDGVISRLIDIETGGVFLLLLLLILLLIYYYVRRRRMYDASRVSWDDDSE